MQKTKQLKKELEYAQYEDPDSAILLEIKRIEVQESNIIGQSAIRVVFKPESQKIIIAPKTPD